MRADARLLGTDDLALLELPLDVGSGRTFVDDERSLSLRLYRHRDMILGVVRFGDPCVGPPGHAHGGVCGYVLDEAMASAVFARGCPSAATTLRFELLRMTPLRIDLRVEARIVGAPPSIDLEAPAGATFSVESQLMSPDGGVLMKGAGEFRVLSRRTWKALAREQA